MNNKNDLQMKTKYVVRKVLFTSNIRWLVSAYSPVGNYLLENR